jgi:hypothetical protein
MAKCEKGGCRAIITLHGRLGIGRELGTRFILQPNIELLRENPAPGLACKVNWVSLIGEVLVRVKTPSLLASAHSHPS